MVLVFVVAVVALLLGAAAPEVWAKRFDDAKIYFEYNATDNDLGIQFFLDGEDWKRVRIVGPDGRILKIEAIGSVFEIGLTELFCESAEPELGEDLSPEEFLDLFPEGEYRFVGRTVEGRRLRGKPMLVHDLPAAVSVDDGGYPPTIAWTDNSMEGDPEIVGYQVIVSLVVEENDEERVFEFTVDLLGDATEVTVPDEFVDLAEGYDEADIVEYKLEVIAIAASGNKTITEESLLD